MAERGSTVTRLVLVEKELDLSKEYRLSVADVISNGNAFGKSRRQKSTGCCNIADKQARSRNYNLHHNVDRRSVVGQ